MPSHNYKWPNKIKRFGINDPFLKILVAKYEREIPWQTQVRNESELRQYVAEQMLPKQIQRITFPAVAGSRHCFVEAKDVNLKLALDAEIGLDANDIAILKLIQEEDGDDCAARELALLINGNKARAFNSWRKLFAEQYAAQAAFALLFLRPLLDMSPAGSRRTVNLPAASVVEWLFRHIERERVSPNENIALLYIRKIADSALARRRDGWQYIPADESMATVLAANCQNSGWCVASSYWAKAYLRRSAFYILRANDKPVVALRFIPKTGEIVECQGKHNSSPTGWFADIALFAATQNLILQHRNEELGQALAALGSFSDMPDSWWQQRTIYWPFALQHAPQHRPQAMGPEIWASYLGFPNIGNLLQQSGITIGMNDWASLVNATPAIYANVPEEHRRNPAIITACLNGIRANMQDEEFSLIHLKRLPETIKALPEFRALLAENWPSDIQRRITSIGKSAVERLNPFSLDYILPLEQDDPLPIAIHHAVNQLLANGTADFSDTVFSEGIRSRPDFAEVRKQAWIKAIQYRPTHWFALPADLHQIPELVPANGPAARINLDTWLAKIAEKPWLMTQKSGVPKAIRFHQRTLDAYKQGWKSIFCRTPWQVWQRCNKASANRVYASYALLEQPDVIDAFAIGWRNCLKNTPWTTASERMRKMAFMQLALLKSFGIEQRRLNTAEFAACQDILKNHDKQKPASALTPIELEVRRWMQHFGFLLNMEQVASPSRLAETDTTQA